MRFLRIARPEPKSGGLRIGPVEVPTVIADAGEAVKDLPGLTIRHLGPVAGDVADTGGDVAAELFGRLKAVYGAGEATTDRLGPPAPGQKVPGPFKGTPASGLPGASGGGGILSGTLPGVSGFDRSLRNIAIATAHDPRGVTSNTIKGFYEIGAGVVGMLGEAYKDPSVLKRIPRQVVEDYGRRYGPLLDGTAEGEQKFRKRVQEEGVAPEILDALTIGVPAGGLAGRGATALARAGKITRPLEEFVKSERRGLQVTGGKVRPQERHPNLFRALREERKDVRRQRRTATRMSRADRNRAAVRGLVPGGRTVKVRPSRAELFMAGEGREALRLRPAARLQDVSNDIVAPRTLRGQQWFEKREAARVGSLAHEAHRMDRLAEIDTGFRKELSSLSRKQRLATFHVAQGVIDPTDEGRAVAQLKARRSRLIEEGATPGPRMMSKTNNEVRLIDYLIRNSKDIFGGEKGANLAKVQRSWAERSLRLEQSEARRVGTYGEATAEARRLRAQAEGAGLPVRYPTEAIEELDDAIQGASDPAEAAAAKQAQERLLRTYSAQVRAAREADELTPSVEPAFVTHEKSNVFGSGAFATGGSRAVVGPKRSQMELLRTGRANVTPQALEQSIAKSLKRIHNWELVARQAEVSTVNVTPAMIAKAGIFKESAERPGVAVPKSAAELSIDEWRKVLRAHNMDQRDWAFWNPGRMRLRQEQLHALDADEVDGAEASADVALSDAGGAAIYDKAVRESMVPAGEAAGPIVKSKGWRLIPRAAYDEIMDSTHPSGAWGRGFAKVQGFQSRILLGLSPSWLQMQAASNAMLATGALRGNVVAFLRSPIFWHGFRQKEPGLMRAIDEQLGSSVLQAHGQKIRFGASLDQRPTMDAVVNMIDGFSELPVMRQIKRGGTVAGKRLPAPNPINGMFFLDQLQNRYFRHAVLYNDVKRAAYKRMGERMGQAARYQHQFADLVRGKDPVEQMKAILENPALLEKHVRAVEDWLGNYTTFTAFERRVLKRSILFYGFLRHSTRLLFYTLPVKHPGILAVAAKLTQLRNEEVRDLLGGDAVPWAFSRVYIDERTGEVATRETPQSAVRSVDLYRLNPVTNALVEAIEDPKKIAGLMSPAAQILFDQIYSTKAFSGQGFQIEGSAAYRSDLPLFSLQRAQIALGSALSTAYPYRKAVQLRAGGHSQADDALLWHMEPMRYKTAQARQRERGRIRRYRETSPVADLVPLLGLADARFAKPDTTRADVRRRKKAESGSSSSGGGGGWGAAGGGGSSSSGGGWGSAAGG